MILVPIDVIATDDHNVPVTDLKQEDFEVYENGRRQEIRHFAVQTLTASAPGPAEPSTIRIPSVIDAAPQSARTFLILLGRGRHQQALKAIDALIEFVRRDLLPQDRVAVYAYNRATDFTTDRDQIVQVLERYKLVSDNIESWLELNLSGFRVLYGPRGLPESLQPQVAGIFEAPGTPASRRVPPGRLTAEGKIVRDWELATTLILGASDRAAETEVRADMAKDVASTGMQGSQVMQSLLAFDELQLNSIALELPFGEFISRSGSSLEDMQNLFTGIEYLRYVGGEKHLLFFSGKGLLFPYGNTDYDKGIAAVANDARVAIDTFHTGGLSPTMIPKGGVTPSTGPLSGWADTAQAQNLRNIAALTGGQASIYQEIGKALDTVNATTRAQYLLGYYPADTNWNGRYRQIQVKVKRPGVRLYTRRGYFARDRLQPYDKTEFLAYSRISAAGGWPGIIDDLPFRIDTSKSRDNAGQAQVKLDIKIDGSKVVLRTAGGVHTGRLRVAVFYADSRERMLGEIWRNVDLNLREDTYKEYVKSGIPFAIDVPAKTGVMYMTAVVYDMQGDKVGTRRVSVGR